MSDVKLCLESITHVFIVQKSTYGDLSPKRQYVEKYTSFGWFSMDQKETKLYTGPGKKSAAHILEAAVAPTNLWAPE